MKKPNREKLINAVGMLTGLSWVVEEKCENSVEAIWMVINDLREIIDDEECADE